MCYVWGVYGVCECACAQCMHECVCVCLSFSIETCSWNANRHLTTACNGSGFIGICVKAVYIVPSTVTNRHDNAVRQGLVSPFLCLTSLGNVYTLTLKWAPQYCVPILIQSYNKPALSEVIGGKMPADPFIENFNIPSTDNFNPLSKNFKIEFPTTGSNYV